MSPKARLFTLFAGAAALAGLTYGFGRLALRQRSPAAISEKRAQFAEAALEAAPAPQAWELAMADQRLSSDALDLALDLDGIFDGTPGDSSGVTVRSNDRVPVAASGDDEDPPSPDSLGRIWLAQATQSERSFTEADLSTELDELPALEDDSSEPSEDGERDS
ncbi:MAG: hypothetical protein ABIQ16_08385 [Polyangiaceae bacterium]